MSDTLVLAVDVDVLVQSHTIFIVTYRLAGRDSWLGLRSEHNQIGWEFRGRRSRIHGGGRGNLFNGLVSSDI